MKRNGVKSPPIQGKWTSSNPEVEAHKAHRANIGHARAVAVSEHLRLQHLELWKPMASPVVELKAIILALQAKKIPFVLTGAHALGSYTGRPRATHDVDILVKSGRNHMRAVNAIKALYPELEVRQLPWLTAFFRPGETESVIDVSFPHRGDNAAALETAIWIEHEGLRYRVPTREAALANKYGAMLAVGRDVGKRLIDAADFYFMVRHADDEGQTRIDLEQIEALGEMVWPGGGGKELLRLVEMARAGETPDIKQLAGKEPQ